MSSRKGSHSEEVERMAHGIWIWTALLSLVVLACGGGDRPVGSIQGERRSERALAAELQAQGSAAAALERKAGAPRALPAKRILFGDLHAHSTYSIDAFAFSLPLLAGEGAHPPADACDFARYCAALSFFALTDHAEGLTPKHWELEKRNIRECNARAGDTANPDLVAFMGFEWTQVGQTPESHYGHKNVIFLGLGDDELPTRPISSVGESGPRLFEGFHVVRRWRWFDPLGWREYADFLWLVDELAGTPRCERGVSTRELPPDCREGAPTPDLLFEKLAQWDLDVLVIPHGTTWGLYTPPGSSMDKQLDRRQHDPERQQLIEIMSGHGNSEEYRAWREFEVDEAGNAICPEPTRDYLPCCWRAGEIMRERCGELPEQECEARVEEAKRLAIQANVSPHLVFPDTRAEDWLDCGQCRDCFKPSLGYRPRESVQYTMAISNFEQAEANGKPLRFRYGFVASSDVHTARPGTGYKQYQRRMMTEATGVRSQFYGDLDRRQRRLGELDPQRPQRVPAELSGLLSADVERIASYLYPGGLVAAHAEGRNREAIWGALKRREVYGTSGPRILLWFDLLNGPDGPVPMGSSVTLAEVPRFQVRAVGSFVQEPGCPEENLQGLGPERLERLCRGECYHPGDDRHPIVSIEVIRIHPQAHPGEDVDQMIEDVWKRFDCEPQQDGCLISFEDPEYPSSGRDVLYYVRAIQEETPAVNGANLRTEYDAEGNAVRTTPCYGDYRTRFDDDCLAPVQERAWSSPIFLDQPL
jgi:hypothetical protein